jgi:hypothetical protein
VYKSSGSGQSQGISLRQAGGALVSTGEALVNTAMAGKSSSDEISVILQKFKNKMSVGRRKVENVVVLVELRGKTDRGLKDGDVFSLYTRSLSI